MGALGARVRDSNRNCLADLLLYSEVPLLCVGPGIVRGRDGRRIPQLIHLELIEGFAIYRGCGATCGQNDVWRAGGVYREWRADAVCRRGAIGRPDVGCARTGVPIPTRILGERNIVGEPEDAIPCVEYRVLTEAVWRSKAGRILHVVGVDSI